jgi:oligopeptide transport system ATP-binding protein
MPLTPSSGTEAVPNPVLSVRNLTTHFETGVGITAAVNDVTFDVMPGEAIGVVGESGSGKSALALSILGLVPTPGRVVGGQVVLSLDDTSRDLTTLTEPQLRRVRGREVALIFQNAMTSLNPVFRIGDQVSEPLRVHLGQGRRRARRAAADLLTQVGIPDPERRARQYPHELSGGMRQRAMIAMALATRPAILIADEPTSALDVTIQAQVLETMQTMRRAVGSAIILITHDFGVVAGLADKVIVMYAGRIVETGAVEEVFYTPQHPYTIGLLGSVPRLDLPGKGRLAAIPGQPPNLVNIDDHRCPFAHRCRWVHDACLDGFPAYDRLSQTHRAACILDRATRTRIARMELAGSPSAAG